VPLFGGNMKGGSGGQKSGFGGFGGPPTFILFW